MRFISSLLLIFCLAACQRGGQNNSDAVRQGVLDHLAKANLNMSGMDVKVAKVDFNSAGDKAEATVNITAKGQTAAEPMVMNYKLERQNNNWVVVGPAAGSAGHGGAAPATDPNAGGANPHGGAMPDMPGSAGKMPSPQDLPPATKK